MRRLPTAIVVISLIAVGAAAWYLYDPPWIARVTSGMRDWEEDAGVRFRWTSGRSSFFIPATASEMTLPLRAVFPIDAGQPVVVSMAIDDRWIANFELKDPSEWVRPAIPLPRRTSRRSYRRLELRVSRVVGFYNLGVQVGEPSFK